MPTLPPLTTSEAATPMTRDGFDFVSTAKEDDDDAYFVQSHL